MTYGLAHYFQSAVMRVRFWALGTSGLQAKDIFPFRSIAPTGGLQTAVTNICNAKCSFCAYPQAVQSGALQRGVMSMELFKKAVQEWSQLGGQVLDLTPTVGDTLLDPDLIAKIHYAVRDAGVKTVVLTTNAILINRNNLYRDLVDSGLAAVFISTQGTDPEVYRQIYRVDKYDEVRSGLHHLLEYNRSRGEPVEIGIRYRNAQKPSDIIKSKDFKETILPYLSSRVRVNFTVNYDNWGGAITPAEMFGAMRLRRLPKPVNLPCKNLFTYAVRHDGLVRLCGCRFKTSDNDDMVVGNLKAQPLAEISTNQRAWQIIEGFYEGRRPEACQKCTFYVPVTKKWLRQRQQSPAAKGGDSAQPARAFQ